jgi:hypothetical protein
VPSVDEKTGIGARGRTRPRKPVAPGRPARQEHEYVRHGTATLLAALDVHRGGVLQAAGVDRNTAANFVAFLDELDACVPTEPCGAPGARQRVCAHRQRDPLVVP